MSQVAVQIVFNKIPQLSALATQRAKSAVTKASRDIEAAAKLSMQGPKSGIVYSRRGTEHQASAPGEAPAIDTGQLAGSIGVEFSDNGLTGEIGPSAEHGFWLEFGTRNMAPRPFMTPAAEKEREPFLAAMRQIAEM